MALSNRDVKRTNKLYKGKAAKKGMVRFKAKKTAKAIGGVAKASFKVGASKSTRDDKKLNRDLGKLKTMRKELKATSKDKRVVKGARKDAKRIGRVLAVGNVAARAGAAAGRGYKFTAARKAALQKAVRASAAKRRRG